MVKLLIDTCVWLDVAKTTKGGQILNLLAEFISSGKVDIVLPEIVMAEFARNKDRVIAEAGKSLSSHFKNVKDAVRDHGDILRKEEILTVLDDIDKKIPILGESAAKTVSKIHDLITNSEIIQLSDAIKLRAAQRAIEKKAPFHLSKNSMGDAIIIESYDYYRRQTQAQPFNLIFVTHNIQDFSKRNGNQKHPHEDFSEIFESPRSKYFISLPEALNSIDPELVEEVQYENDWDVEFRPMSEIFEAERELSLKVWYNRHKLRESLIEEGKIQLIPKSKYNPKDAHKTIVKDIWKGALRSAKKVEREFGKENLLFDDFEWGMLNGKLSAVRWVTGEEWDNLDT